MSLNTYEVGDVAAAAASVVFGLTLSCCCVEVVEAEGAAAEDFCVAEEALGGCEGAADISGRGALS